MYFTASRTIPTFEGIDDNGETVPVDSSGFPLDPNHPFVIQHYYISGSYEYRGIVELDPSNNSHEFVVGERTSPTDSPLFDVGLGGDLQALGDKLLFRDGGSYGQGGLWTYDPVTGTTEQLHAAPQIHNHVSLDEGSVTTLGSAIYLAFSDVATGNELYVLSEATPPSANAGGPYTGTEGAGITLDGTGSADAETPAASLIYEWDLDYDGSTFQVDTTGVQPTVNFEDDFATRNIALRVTDPGGLSDLAVTTLTVQNAPPVILSLPDATGKAGQAVTFSVSASDPGVNDSLTYSWDFGQGDPQSGVNLVSPTHTYSASGTYNGTLTVTDDAGESVQGSFAVVIAEAAYDDPRAARLEIGPSDAQITMSQQVSYSSTDTVSFDYRFTGEPGYILVDLDGSTVNGSNPSNGPLGGDYQTVSLPLSSFPGSSDATLRFRISGDPGTSVEIDNVRISGRLVPNGDFQLDLVGWTTNEADGVIETVDILPNQAPQFSDATLPIEENTFLAGILAAIDNEQPSDTLTYTLTGAGPDDALFTIRPGARLSFLTAPDYEAPSDADGDNSYVIEVQATDAIGQSDIATITIDVADSASAVPGLAPLDTYHRVFATNIQTRLTTSRRVPPSLPSFGGIEAASWVVTYFAFRAGVLKDWNGSDVVYRAALSDGTANAIDHTNVQGPLYNMQDELLAVGAADFFDGQLLNPIGFDEFGSPIPAGRDAMWSGNSTGGTNYSATCGNWDLTGESITFAGSANSTNWLIGPTLQCDNDSARLLAVSPPLLAAYDDPRAARLEVGDGPASIEKTIFYAPAFSIDLDYRLEGPPGELVVTVAGFEVGRFSASSGTDFVSERIDLDILPGSGFGPMQLTLVGPQGASVLIDNIEISPISLGNGGFQTDLDTWTANVGTGIAETVPLPYVHPVLPPIAVNDVFATSEDDTLWVGSESGLLVNDMPRRQQTSSYQQLMGRVSWPISPLNSPPRHLTRRFQRIRKH
ncbi:MAG: PKD domain-containing protein [Pirellulaceae bacterium]